jgi:hypothetical protein
MSYTMRETPEQIAQKDSMMQHYTGYLGDQIWYRGLYEPKYKIDCVIGDNDGILAYVECKTSSSHQGCLLNVSKMERGMSLAKASNCLFILLAQHPSGKIGAVTLASNDSVCFDLKAHWQEDRRAGHNNGDDSEPCILVPWNLFQDTQ